MGRNLNQWDRGAGWVPVVTAILPCYNAEAFLSRTLDSLSAQTWPNLEILIGDDASTDGTLRIVEAFAEERGDVRVIARKQNLGWIGNTNDLMANASGELMFFAFHDDVVSPTYIERLVLALQHNSCAVLAYCDLDVTSADGIHKFAVFDWASRHRSPLARGYSMATKVRGWSIPNRGLFRSEAFHRIGGIKRHDEGEFSADWPWLLHMAIIGEFEWVPEPLCQKFFQKNSISRNWERSADEQISVVRSATREIRISNLGLIAKFFLIVYLRLRQAKIWASSQIPQSLKNFVKRLIA